MTTPRKFYKGASVRFLATDPSGVSRNLESKITQCLDAIIGARYDNAVVKSVRFLPSTKSHLSPDNFEIIANAIVKLDAPAKQGRVEQLETVMTFSDAANAQDLMGISIPQFIAADTGRDWGAAAGAVLG
ncbi:MAG TPA: hypothetical protein VGD66_00490 [Allosphingosinicella sp.]|jgi:hypothetical protein